MAITSKKSHQSSSPRIRSIGEDMVLVEFEQRIDLTINKRAHTLAAEIEHATDAGQIVGITEVIPAYCSVLTYYDPDQTCQTTVVKQISQLAGRRISKTSQTSRLFRIPTAYTPKYGPDLDDVAQAANMTRNEVIERFSTTIFPVYCL